MKCNFMNTNLTNLTNSWSSKSRSSELGIC